MKNTGKLAAVICLSMAVSMFAACDSTTKQTKETKETEAVTEAVTEAPSEDPTEAPTEAPTDPAPDPSDKTGIADDLLGAGYSEDRYTAYRDLATLLIERDDDMRFGYNEDYSTTPPSYSLETYCPTTGEYACYFCDGGVMTLVDSYFIEEEFSQGIMNITCPYDVFMKIPCMCMVFTDTFSDNLADGRYFGSVMAVTDDASELLVYAGHQISLTEEEYLALKPGDQIEAGFYGYDYFTVLLVDESKTDSNRVEFDFDPEDPFKFEQGGAYAENDTDFVLMAPNDCPVYTNDSIAILTLASDCKIDDEGFSVFTLPEGFEADAKAYAESQGVEAPFATSACYYYFFSVQEDGFGYESSNGWTPVYGCLWPFEVTSGQISYMNLEIR